VDDHGSDRRPDSRHAPRTAAPTRDGTLAVNTAIASVTGSAACSTSRMDLVGAQG
jgi:hypothetical protein